MAIETKIQGPAREREFVFTQRDFEAIRQLIYEHAGIALGPAKKDMVYSRIARRLRALGLKTFQDYLDILDSQSDEWTQFINALTTNLTAFFREAHHFPILAEHALELKRRGRQRLRLWSSACSTGEEPYSMAMTLIDAFKTWTPPLEILATDVDTNVLDQAAKGVYPLERLEKLPPEQLKRFFLRGKGAYTGLVRVRPELRALVEFQPLNLLSDSWPMREPFDVIFCRNVMIYFDKPTQARILSRFHTLLRPDGLLFVGHSESLSHVPHLFRLRGKTVYVPVHGA
ncbi:chemotaxis protein CheR [Caldichromatium japonicum]|uniref:Chemotaxis protein methyltransferase n=1 Tax=Caldichromatium japonicum TaxID=2699430 RepID=A0A6G7VDY3_9GAMM|nr:CheR family methyltransferase [Caldichromatium japonicum]QIK38283.1 chemotaxis protein CheR [Caldichromatium japonicum]